MLTGPPPKFHGTRDILASQLFDYCLEQARPHV